MLRLFLNRVLEPRHYWRRVQFDELSELYTSVMLRSTGMSLVGIFVPVYLYMLGYDLGRVFFFLALIFLGRAISEIPTGYLTALIGPKHTMLLSYMFQIVSLLLLLTLPTYDWPLWTIAIAWGIASTMYFVAYHVDFSKVMHADHGGKELGFMTIVERFGGVLGPLIGGIIAAVFGPQYTILVAMLLFVIAVMPLFATPEPTHTHQKISFGQLPLKRLKRDFIALFALGAENTLSVSLWPLYIAIVIFTVNPYVSIGVVTSVGVVAAILSAHLIGKRVDRHEGGRLLKFSVLGNSLVHLTRPFIMGAGGVLLVNVLNEAITTGFKIPFVKGFYDRADNLPGYRIVYIVYAELAGDIGKAVPWIVLGLMTFFMSDLLVMQIGFVFAALFSLLILTQRFPALRS